MIPAIELGSHLLRVPNVAVEQPPIDLSEISDTEIEQTARLSRARTPFTPQAGDKIRPVPRPVAGVRHDNWSLQIPQLLHPVQRGRIRSEINHLIRDPPAVKSTPGGIALHTGRLRIDGDSHHASFTTPTLGVNDGLCDSTTEMIPVRLQLLHLHP